MALVIPSIFTAIDKFSAPVRAMGNSAASFATRAEGAVQRADRAMNKYTGVLSHAQKELLGTLGAAELAYKGIEALDFGFEQIKDYDGALTKLQTNFRLSDAALLPFKKQIQEVANESYISAGKISDVFNIIGSKNRELLKDPEALGRIAKSSVTLSEAWSEDLAPSAQNLVNIMSAFKLTDSSRTIDILAGASSVGAIKGNELAAALASIASEANHAHVGLSQTAAILQFVDKSTNAGADGATDFVKSLLKLESLGNSYKNSFGKFDLSTAITKLRSQLNRMPSELSQNDFLSKLFGPRKIKVARSLLAPGATAELADYVSKIEQTGIAEEMAAKNTATLEHALERVKVAFYNALIQSNKTGTALNSLKNVLVFVYKNMDTILKLTGYLIGAFLTWKAVVLATTAVTKGLAVAEFILSNALSFVAAAQIAFNLALYACPLVWILGMVVALAAVVYESVVHWDTWGKKITVVFAIFLPYLAVVITLLKSVYDHWQNITNSFNNGGIISGIKAMGRAIEDFLLRPLQIVFQAMSHLPGFAGGNAAAAAAKNIGEMRADLNANENGTATKPVVSLEKSRQQALLSRTESTQNQNVKIHINDSTGRANVTSDNDMVQVQTTRTGGNGFGFDYGKF